MKLTRLIPFVLSAILSTTIWNSPAYGQDKSKVFVHFKMDVPLCDRELETTGILLSILNEERETRLWKFEAAPDMVSRPALHLELNATPTSFKLSFELYSERRSEISIFPPLSPPGARISGNTKCSEWPLKVADAVRIEVKKDVFRNKFYETVVLGKEARAIGELNAVLPLDVSKYPEFLELNVVSIKYYRDGDGWITLVSNAVGCATHPDQSNAIKVRHLKKKNPVDIESNIDAATDNYSDLLRGTFTLLKLADVSPPCVSGVPRPTILPGGAIQ